MDTAGEYFDKAVSLYRSNISAEYYEKFNPEHSGWGSHIRILSAAALATSGDILEIGTGFFSTKVLHEIAERKASEILKDVTGRSLLG